MKRKGTKDLTLTQRRELENYLKAGLHKKHIAELLGVCLATVYNELKRGECTQKVYSYTDYWGERHYKEVTVYSADIAEYKYRLNQSSTVLKSLFSAVNAQTFTIATRTQVANAAVTSG